MFGPFDNTFVPVFMFACRNPDAYHTAYCISGLSAAQHHVYPSPARREVIRAAWEGEDGVRASAFAEALCWTEEDGGSQIIGSAANRVVRRSLHL
jgi:protein farnesyltransferase subunit beta